MSLTKLVLIISWTAVGVIAGIFVVRSFWRLRSEWQRWQAGEPALQSTRAMIWRDPGPADRLDLAAGPGGVDGAPAPPFTFVEEHATGSQPCMSVRDARGRLWRAKWGAEVNTEAFCTRLVWAVGYFVETTYFVAGGTIGGAADLRRAKDCVDAQGRFSNARFELDEAGVVKHFDAHSWAWHDNPFVGSHELNGLKILVMLLSNWDNKDVRDVSRGSNTAIFEYPAAKHGRDARYLIIDWGAALGAWGTTVLSRGRWNCQVYSEQTAQLITGTEGDRVSWGYSGQRTVDATDDISRADVRWLYRYLGPLTDAQLSAALTASGATEQEAADFTTALRARIERLKEIAELP